MAARYLADVRDAALFPNYFGQTCYTYHRVIWTVLNKIFDFGFLSYWLQRDQDGSVSESHGTGTGPRVEAMGAGRERD